jgi:DNA-binding winged helix-turn-helix (wHTH) protein
MRKEDDGAAESTVVSQQSAVRGAVFLSYASEDASAAARIATALRNSHIEVWFDRNELRGGDAWDRQIRRQIRECALFLPIISANSEARHEGYFRLEWDLADQRTHLMGRNRAFVVPICIDTTPERDADVPDSFLAVHWTHLPAGDASPAFIERIQRLLSGERTRAPSTPAAASTRASTETVVARSTGTRPRPRRGGSADARALNDTGDSALDRVRCGDFEIDPANRRFTRRGVEVPLEPKVLAVILQLLARAGALITRDELLDAVWGHRYVTRFALNRVIALARRAFEDDTGDPKYIATVHGAGYRYIGPIERTDPAEAVRPVRFAPPPTARLPARVEDLIGRDADLSQIAQLLLSQRGVTVLGPGGIGKTQFALEAARRNSENFPDGVWFFDLAPMKRAEEWLRALAGVLGVPTTDNSDPLGRIVTLLQDRHALLVLDNCDRIAVEVGTQVIEILRGTGALKVLATSQTPLNFAGEQLLRLAPLELPPAETPGADGWQHVETAAASAHAARPRALGATRIRGRCDECLQHRQHLPPPGRDAAGIGAGCCPLCATVCRTGAAAPERPVPIPEQHRRRA